MKKFIYTILSAIIFISCSINLGAYNNRHSSRPLPEPISVDPYEGMGTRNQYLRLAREWEARYLDYQAKASSCLERMMNTAYRTVNNSINSYSRQSNRSGRSYSSYNTSRTSTSRMLRERSQRLQLQNRYEEYLEMAYQARAEQRKYLEMARNAMN